MNVSWVLGTALVLFLAVSGTAQSRGGQKPQRPRTLGKVTVKGGGGAGLPKLPSESDPASWHRFDGPDGSFRVSFPSGPGEVEEQEVPNGAVLFEARAERATYSLLVRDYPADLGRQSLREIYDGMVTRFTGGYGMRLIADSEMTTGGRAGRDIVAETRTSRIFGRFLLSGGRLYILSVLVARDAYSREFDRWPAQFFDSLELPGLGTTDG